MKEIDVNKLLASKKSWKKIYTYYYDILKHTLGTDNNLSQKIKVKLADGNIVSLTLPDFIVNIVMWRPMITFKTAPTKNEVFDCTCITQSVIKNYLDTIYIRPYRSKVESKILNEELCEIIERLKRFVEDFGIILGITYNFYQIKKMCEKNKRFKELIHCHIPEGLQPAEVEEFGKGVKSELIDILSKSNTGFAPLLNSEAGFNTNQFLECLGIIGNKPDLDGNTLPVPIDSNIMIRGLDSPTHYYLDATGGRKALIMNKKYTGNSGYFSRKLNLLTLDTKLHPDPNYDCGTKHHLKYLIDDMDSLLRIEGRYYKLNLDDKEYKIIKYDDTNLIGKVIYMRTPTKCCGDKICRMCYGELYDTNIDIAPGVIGSTNLSSRFTQKILSSKHAMITKSQKIEFDKDIEKLFILDGNQLFLDESSDLLNSNLYLTIYNSSLNAEVDDEVNEDEDGEVNIEVYNTLECDAMYITDSSKNKLIEVKEHNGMILNISEYLKSLIDKYDRNGKVVRIPLSTISSDEVLASIDVANFELTKTLIQVKGILEKEEHGNCTDIDSLIYKFNRLLIDGSIYIHLVHAEIIVRNLIRSNTDILERPDFTKDNPEYIILTVQKALINNPSPLISLSFERVEEQLKSVLTFRKKKRSTIDQLFLEKYVENYNIDVK